MSVISSRSTGEALHHVNYSIVFNRYAGIVGLLLNVKVTMKYKSTCAANS